MKTVKRVTTKVHKITTSADKQKAQEIRKIVFVEGQQVPEEEEIDQYEEECEHFLAWQGATPCGACRYRFTENGVKLERFAVLEGFRGQGVGSALVEACLADVKQHSQYSGQQLYLNAQLDAIPLYRKYGFATVGDEFLECDIRHLKMIKE